MSGHVVPAKTYLWIVAALLLLTLATTEVARIDLGVLNPVVAMLIAAVKTLLVVLFFMHMKWSNYRSQIVAAAGLLWLAVMILLTLSDYRTRDWMPGPGAWPIHVYRSAALKPH
jgi:cytochrome c oxidase subunit IV